MFYVTNSIEQTLLEKLVTVHLVKKFTALYETKGSLLC